MLEIFVPVGHNTIIFIQTQLYHGLLEHQKCVLSLSVPRQDLAYILDCVMLVIASYAWVVKVPGQVFRRCTHGTIDCLRFL